MKMEQTVSQRATREYLQRKITLLLARMTDRSGHLLFAPEALLLKRLGLKGLRRDPRYKIREAMRRMKKKGLIKYERTSNGWSARLTAAGRRLAKKMEQAERILIVKPAKWDGRWRIVTFDIWERRRGIRNKLRLLLKKMGFYKLQASIWVHPYDCEALVAFVRADLHLGGGVVYIIADGIENDFKIRRHFKLS